MCRTCDVDADAIELHGFTVHDPNGPSPAEKEAALKAAMEAMGPPRFSSRGPDGTLVERTLSQGLREAGSGRQGQPLGIRPDARTGAARLPSWAVPDFPPAGPSRTPNS